MNDVADGLWTATPTQIRAGSYNAMEEWGVTALASCKKIELDPGPLRKNSLTLMSNNEPQGNWLSKFINILGFEQRQIYSSGTWTNNLLIDVSVLYQLLPHSQWCL